MGEAKTEGYDRKGRLGECSKPDQPEVFIGKEPEQKSAPKNLLDKWDNDDKPEKSKHSPQPVAPWMGPENIRIETNGACRRSKKLLQRDPKKKDDHGHCDGENDVSWSFKIIFAPKPNQ